MIDLKPWLVTWSTYGAWLPGDPRGFQTRRGRQHVPPPVRYAAPGEDVYDARRYRALFEYARSLSRGAIFLTGR
ncbi:MAG: hypothetical protein BIFFINMI_01517 [Phycisphaerae bacterium]|nr:hypothetical protein [Phycisphaerae bacterium]